MTERKPVAGKAVQAEVVVSKPKPMSPSAHVNDPSVIPSSNLKVQLENILAGYDTDVSLLNLEIESRTARRADIETARDAVLAALQVLEPKPQKALE